MGKLQYSDSDLSTSREDSFDQSMSRNAITMHDIRLFGNIAQKYPILLTYCMSITYCDRIAIEHTFAQFKHDLYSSFIRSGNIPAIVSREASSYLQITVKLESVDVVGISFTIL